MTKHKRSLGLGNQGQGCAECEPELRSFIGYLKISICIPHSRSLKDRRQVIESVKKRVRNNFNVSIAQAPSNSWKYCELFLMYTNYTKQRVSESLEKIYEYLSANKNMYITSQEKGII